MSNIHGLEPQAHGLIIFKTTFGDLELELFTKQCPKNTRNFIQLCLDGYYEGTIFDRVEKDFIAIGGKDPGKSEDHYDIDFDIAPDEFHSRLKFSRRGLLATANTEKDVNGPEFFFTLGPAPELQNKHTIFGRLISNSVYRLVDLNECSVDDDMVPISEKVITQVDVVDSPYPELKPRPDFIRALRKSRGNNEDTDDLKQANNTYEDGDDGYLKPKFDIKNSKKLSFYQDSESEDEDDDKQVVADTKFKVPDPIQQEPQKPSVSENPEVDLEDRAKFDGDMAESNEDAREKRLREIREQLKNFKKQLENESATKIRTLTERKRSSEEQDSHNATLESKANSSKQSSIDAESDPTTAKQLRLATKKGRQRERETLELMEQFKKKLKESKSVSASSAITTSQHEVAGSSVLRHSAELDVPEEHLDDVALDLVDGDDWLSHKFDAESTGDILAKDANTRGDDWYSIDDPRNPVVQRVESERARDYKDHSSRRHDGRDRDDDDTDNDDYRRRHHSKRSHSSHRHHRSSSSSHHSRSSDRHRHRER